MSLELRYGREDEELMGLQFSNEMVVVSRQLYPLQTQVDQEIFGCRSSSKLASSTHSLSLLSLTHPLGLQLELISIVPSAACLLKKEKVPILREMLQMLSHDISFAMGHLIGFI